jgi:hypothetical protein
MKTAHDDEAVKVIVRTLIEHWHPDFLELAAIAIISAPGFDPGMAQFHLRTAPLTDENLEAARTMIEAAKRVLRKPLDQRKRCRGAIVEAVVASLVAKRAEVRVEHCIAGLKGETNRVGPLDVIGIGPAGAAADLEIYECKSNPGMDLDERYPRIFRLIEETADLTGTTVLFAFATLRPRSDLVAAALGLECDTPVMGIGREDLLTLDVRAPDVPLRFAS